MAELVGAFGVPHMPNTPLAVRQSPNGELAQLFGAVREQVDAVDPEVLVVFDTDHFATWYYQSCRCSRSAWRSPPPDPAPTIGPA
jgi:hypothetical protein